MTLTLLVGIYALVTALATGLGALPFFFIGKVQKRWLGISNALAAGGMLGASFMLVENGTNIDLLPGLLGVLLGVIFIIATQRLLSYLPQLQVQELPVADVKKMLLIVIVMTVHSLAEGIGIGVAFGNGAEFGALIAIALAIHNIPEGLAISLVLYPRGVSAWKCAGWSIFSSLPQLLAVLAFLFVEHFTPFLPIGLGFAGGAMLWMVVSELVPDALETISRPLTGGVIVLSALAMIALEKVL